MAALVVVEAAVAVAVLMMVVVVEAEVEGAVVLVRGATAIVLSCETAGKPAAG